MAHDKEVHPVKDDDKQPGLGEVIYSVDSDENARAKRRKQEEVTEADVESFPASDPPSYSGAIADADVSDVAGGSGEPER